MRARGAGELPIGDVAQRVHPRGGVVDVVIVGAGIGGATLALALSRSDRTVRILEREPARGRLVRPELLWPATLKTFDRLGVGGRVRSEATVPIAAVDVLRDSRRLFGVRREDLSEALGAAAASADAQALRAMILDAAVETGSVEVTRGAEVTGLLREGDRVTGVVMRRDGRTEEVRARVVAGDDGAASIVRQSLGISLPTRRFPLDFVGVEAPRPPDFPADEGRAWVRARALRAGGVFAGIFLPLPGDRIVGALAVPAGDRERGIDGAFWDELARLTPLATWLRRFVDAPALEPTRRAFGHAERYVADGAALLGDAAHPMSPAGGQGANAAIADAVVLADVIDDALDLDDVSARMLGAYERRRRPANDESLRFSRIAASRIRAARALPGIAWLLTLRLRALDTAPETRRQLVRRAAAAFTSEAPREVAMHPR